MLRVAGASIAFLLVKWLRRGAAVTRPRDLAALAGLSMLGVVLNQSLFLLGVERTTAVHANILITTIPAFTLGVALLLGRERASAAKLAGIALAGAGAIYLGLARGASAAGATVFGDSLVAINSLCYAAYLVLSKDLLKRLEPITVVTYVFLFGTLFMAPVGIPALLKVDGAQLNSKVLLVLLYIIAFPSFLTYLLSIWSLKRTASSLVAMYVYVQPIVTALVAPAVLGERMTARSAVASLIIFTGLALATWGHGRTELVSAEVV
jgi:drug/metabolite transporter (DMT)-like permease